ncbi:MAG: hypothetical protein JWP27_518, partial [Flaviaesturariibacter sp.]|nr:hypothetical protein [Flaviaesturariibacter sp.]
MLKSAGLLPPRLHLLLMRSATRTALLLLALLVAGTAFSQTPVRFTVHNARTEPLPYATVKVRAAADSTLIG